MKIYTITIAQLRVLLTDPEFWKAPVLPISKHRALSQVNNPHAADTDICLVIAEKEDRIVCYIGIIPCKMFVGGAMKKMGLMSCWWADQNRAGISALAVLYKALALYKEEVFVSEFSPSAKAILDKTQKFKLFKKVTGTRYFIRFNFAEILPQKINFFGKLKPLLKLADSILNIFLIPAHRACINKRQSASYKIEYIDFIDDETNKFIQQYQSGNFFNRSKPELNWILEFPWIIASDPPCDEFSKKYYYSSLAKKFKNRCFKILFKNEIVAFVFLTQRDNHFKIPYFYCNPKFVSDVIQCVAMELLINKAATLTVYNSDQFKDELVQQIPFIHKREIPRLSYVSTKISDADLSSNEMQDGDADCVFT